MNTKSAADAYMRGSVESAPPIKIVRMLYQGAVRALAQAKAAGTESVEFQTRIGHADEIVTELRLALRPEFGAEQCANLESLYLFIQDRLVQARCDRESGPVDEAREILETLLEAWNQVEIQAESQA